MRGRTGGGCNKQNSVGRCWPSRPGLRWPSPLVATAAEDRLTRRDGRGPYQLTLLKGIVGDHYRRAAPTPKPQPSVVDRLLERFGPKAD